MKPNLSLAIAAGVGAAILGALLWAVITVVTGFQIGFMAIGVGLLCGFAVSKFGGGSGPKFGLVGGACALFGCLLGNLWSGFGFLADELNVGVVDVATQFDYAMTADVLVETFSPMDLLFYGLAVWEGFKFGGAGGATAEAASSPTSDSSGSGPDML